MHVPVCGSFAAAGRQQRIILRWWLLGTASMALAALAHVGTGTIAVPTGMAAASLSALALRRLGWSALWRALLLPILASTGVAIYWLVVLLPASDDYLTNPASLAYRGPDRLFSALFSVLADDGGRRGRRHCAHRWRRPGALAPANRRIPVRDGVDDRDVGRAGLLRDQRGGNRLPALRDAAPRPTRGVGRRWGRLARQRGRPATGGRRTARAAWSPVPVVFLLAILAAAPLTVGRYERQVGAYQPRSATSLTAAVEWVDSELPEGQAVLTEVRDGKWLEGLTGREALFGQPVRYAFRPAEWQRSADADALLRSS